MGTSSSRCTSQARLDNKTAVITGCNTGIGKETAVDLARRGARVVMACRDVKKAERAAEDIRELTRGDEGTGHVVVVQLDLASLASVRRCAKYLLNTEQQIHLLVNNAGVMACPRAVTEDGLEMQLAVNHLGHFLLTCLLLPRILKSAPARIVNVASNAYVFGQIQMEDMNSEKEYDPVRAYGQSKLANILFTMELARRLHGSDVTTYSLHPGLVSTEVFRHVGEITCGCLEWVVSKVVAPLLKTPEEGAQTTIYCSVDEQLAGESGGYYSDCKKVLPLEKARDSEVARKLWEQSAALVGLDHWDPFNAQDSVSSSIDGEPQTNGTVLQK